jgi:hypothetical protein
MGLLRAILDGSKHRARGKGSSRGRRESQGLAGGGGRHKDGRRRRAGFCGLLRKHFPELESLAEIDAISNVDALESIIESVFDASGADPVRAAILTAAQPN